MHDVSGRLPSGLIAELMGIPRADGERLYELTELMHTTDDAVATPEQRQAATFEMLGYAGETAARKRVEPGDDIASTLVQAEVDGDRPHRRRAAVVLPAARQRRRRHDAQPAGGRRPAAVRPPRRAGPPGRPTSTACSATAVEEMLRYTSPVVHFRRTAMEDTVVRGQPIAAGDKLMVFYGSGNRDEEVFADPDRFDVGRDPNPHMAFGGGGPHLCLGLHVARIEIAVHAARAADPPARPRARRRPGAAGVELHHRRAHDARRVHAGPRLGPIVLTTLGPSRPRLRVAASRPEGGDHRGERLDLVGRAVEVEGDDRLLHAGLGVPRGSGRRAPRPCRRRRRRGSAASADAPSTAASDRFVTVTVAGSRSTSAQCSCSTATLRATTSGVPNRLQASA